MKRSFKDGKFYEVIVKRYYWIPADIGVSQKQFMSWFENMNQEHMARHYNEIGGTRHVSDIQQINFDTYTAKMDVRRAEIKKIEEEKCKKIKEENKMIRQWKRQWKDII